LNNLENKDLGLTEFQDVWRQMQAATDQKSGQENDEIWFTEHHPVYTLGHAATEENIISTNDIPVVRTDRGGQVTYHGPGQLMIYFLLNLRRLNWGPKKLICEMESLIIDLLKQYEINASRRTGAPGIYVQDKKIASIGLKIKRGFCYHGISLNVDMDMKPFDGIVTCGIDSLEVTQINEFAEISIDEVKRDFLQLIKSQGARAA
jgi:lipoyl(octanoyl) transferase